MNQNVTSRNIMYAALAVIVLTVIAVLAFSAGSSTTPSVPDTGNRADTQFINDDGTPDQGRGDRGGGGGSTDDDGTPDQGPGDN
jgi:hypothetical protein